jgi:hypothetical protein
MLLPGTLDMLPPIKPSHGIGCFLTVPASPAFDACLLLSLLQDADIIAVVKKGQVVELGSHNELIQDPIGTCCVPGRIRW